MLFDTHCHINDKPYTNDREEMLQRAFAAGVQYMMCPGTDIHTSAEAVAYSHKYKEVYAAVGIHPEEVEHCRQDRPMTTNRHRALGRTRQFGQLVAEGDDARGRQLGLVQHGGKVVARVRLEAHHAAGHAALRRLGTQQRQHGLVAAVHAVEIADGERATRGDAGVVQAAKDLHEVLN